MRASLARWVGEADAVRLLDQLAVAQVPLELGPARTRVEDLYLSLVGELFERMRTGYEDQNDWARLGNALAQFAAPDRVQENTQKGIATNEALLFAAGAFYLGGFPASAYLTMKAFNVQGVPDLISACNDLLSHSRNPTSEILRRILGALRTRDAQTLEAVVTDAARRDQDLLPEGASQWIPARLFHLLLKRFNQTNLRAVLPDGNSAFWDRLVTSFIDRPQSTWEFFPSQIDAIRRGLLARNETFSLQMPTGAGKTALSETLLYWHLNTNPNDAAILLVPYRALASELRFSLVRRLNAMGISARCAYGGTVPSGDEAHGLDELRMLVATPEALSGLFSAAPEFLRRVSLAICDEGHLLDSGSRGVGLELLLARLSARQPKPRFVFVSAIVPNIEEINTWLGGSNNSVVRSNYRPALAEFALLTSSGNGVGRSIALKLHPHEAPPLSFTIQGFLTREDFQYLNEETERRNTLNFGSVKAQAVATARKALPMGAVAIFAANKRGDQGAIGIGEEVLRQTDVELRLPVPLTFTTAQLLDPAIEYVRTEYGEKWLGTRTLERGVILHHGDIPQETREVLENLVRREAARLIICTATLAEGVNLPIRTLVLYSIQRRRPAGPAENLLARDIKNLVGRAGRAGATTKGLVICANEDQWPILEPVVRQMPGETVVGELRRLIENVQRVLASDANFTLTNDILERATAMHPLIDGIDYTLIDLAAVELGEDELVRMARNLADHTFASRQINEATKNVLKTVFELRARKLLEIRTVGRLGWIRETGAKTRMVNVVESTLLPKREAWDDIADPLQADFVTIMLDWAWSQGDVLDAVRNAYRISEGEEDSVKVSFYECVKRWLDGRSYSEIAQDAGLEVGQVLGIQVSAITFVLQSSVEQAVALLAKLLEAQARGISQPVLDFPAHLRFGVPTATGRILAGAGLRHRRATVEFGRTEVLAGLVEPSHAAILQRVRGSLLEHADAWRERLGTLVYENTLQDVTPRT